MTGLLGEVIDLARALLAENEGGVGRVSLTEGFVGVVGPSPSVVGGGVTGRVSSVDDISWRLVQVPMERSDSLYYRYYIYAVSNWLI
jgi:hypothetical protein